jgi:quinol monooxygenase YgiN
MRIKLLALLAVGAIVVPAAATHAQSPQRGISKGNIIFNYTCEVLPGQEEAFKQLMPKLIAAVQQEPGTMAYEWSMRSDGKTFDTVEIFQDSSAMVAHVKDVVTNYGGDLGKTQKGLRLAVFGNPDAEAKKAIEGFHPDYQTPAGGFMR